MINLREKVSEFEQGKLESSFLQLINKNNGIYMEIHFDSENGEIFIYESKEIRLGKEELINGTLYEKGYNVFVEVNYETPTIYGHDLRCEDLIKYIEKNFKQTKEKHFISNMELEWDEWESFL